MGTDHITLDQRQEWGRKGAAKKWENIRAGKTQSHKEAYERRRQILGETPRMILPHECAFVVAVIDSWRDFWNNRDRVMCNHRNAQVNIRCIKQAHTSEYSHYYVDNKYHFEWW